MGLAINTQSGSSLSDTIRGLEFCAGKGSLKFPSFCSEQHFPELWPGKCVSAWQLGCGKTMGRNWWSFAAKGFI
ncbi:hypothetical protein R3I93_022576 [Phoxinus phoxinus]|uniref:Uncharacterized protein n=1 Tax=Phoxinus phoxinus TaxID=58324 RepID=A0AAN9C487_9TELE